MKILITGKSGQLATELNNRSPQNFDLLAFDRYALDITNETQVSEVIRKYQPQVVVNTAAYTAVDKAEVESKQAFSVNALGPENLAKTCKQFDIRLIHISSDFVFDGMSSAPYQTGDAVKPINVYGESKAAGEVAVRAVLPEAVILRTSWVYSTHGTNFVNTMLSLMNQQDHLKIIADQIGSPTSAHTLVDTIYRLVEQSEISGTYHCSDMGMASWYEFAVAIFHEAKEMGLIPKEKVVEIEPIKSIEYSARAKRPQYSVLDKTSLLKDLGVELQHWRQSLHAVLLEKSIS
ncbi:dTDP-4-dehydrorhamnose reductase [Microbulbifer sp. EKSA005]|uniref:dTDP-4-dehydrorhamnose reductase n=1 Tax=Microbulbifer sp. EKSA005 TaxID=3243364 RepID=UPI0040430FCA